MNGLTTALSASSPPEQARQAFRSGLVRPTAGLSQGYAQANLITLPRADAADFQEFARLNPKPCPLLDVLDGTTEPAIAPEQTCGSICRSTGFGGMASWWMR